MSFDWQQYIELADELLGSAHKAELKQACLRSSMSRAYYGVFCIARSHMANQGQPVPGVNVHHSVREWYINSNSAHKKLIGEHLKTLLRRRKDADYEERAVIDEPTAKLAHQLACDAIKELKIIGACR